MNKFLIRFFDIVFSMTALIVFSPILAVIALIIVLDSSGPVIFRQLRVGKNNLDFRL